MSTFMANKGNIERKWYVIDAAGKPMGKTAVAAADLLRGKLKTDYTPHVDCGDYVVVTNVDKVVFTGKKNTDKVYYRHTGHPGGVKETTPAKVLGGRFPERVLEKAVERMIPRGPLGRAQMKALHLYAGTEHPHEAQQPEVLDVKVLNKKNTRS